MPGVGLAAGSGLDSLLVPSPPPLPLAQTTLTPSATRDFSRPAITGSLAPQDRESTRMGGQVVAEMPVPQGFWWFASTQAKAVSMPCRAVVADSMTRRAPGATPPT